MVFRVDPVRTAIAPAGASRTAAPGFTLPPNASPAASPNAAASAMTATLPVSALLALQAGEAGLPAVRARQIQRGRQALDRLEALQRALLLGQDDATAEAALAGLDGALEPTGDADLDGLLAQIETRRAVELAKREMARKARRAPSAVDERR